MTNELIEFSYPDRKVVRAIFNKGNFNMFFMNNKKNIIGIKIPNNHPNLGQVFLEDETGKYVIYTKSKYLPRR